MTVFVVGKTNTSLVRYDRREKKRNEKNKIVLCCLV